MTSKKTNRQISKPVIDEEESKLFGSNVSTSDSNALPMSFSKPLSIHEFMSDLKVRRKDQMENVTHVLVYFFTEHVDEQVENKIHREMSYTKLPDITKHFVYLRPEMITLVNGKATDVKDRFKSLSRSYYEIYRDSLIRFETHVPRRCKSLITAKYEPVTDENGNFIIMPSKELKLDSKVNCLVILTEGIEKQVDSKFNVFGPNVITFYEFVVNAEKEDTPTYQYLMKKRYNDSTKVEFKEATDVDTSGMIPDDDA